MAAVSRADATWEGDLTSGGGSVKPATGAFPEVPISWAARTEHTTGKTSPEELIAAAHAACYCMAFSNGLSKAGHEVLRLQVTAEVEFVPGKGITSSSLTVSGHVHGITEGEFRQQAEAAKDGCPVSQALKGNVELRLNVNLEP